MRDARISPTRRPVADLILASNSIDVAHCRHKASTNCLALVEWPLGGEGISVPFQALAKEHRLASIFSIPENTILRNERPIGLN